MIARILLLVALAFGVLVAPARAQFADQATYAGAATGTNAQAITLNNVAAYTDLLGVLVKFVPGGANSTAATLNVNGIGAINLRKPSPSGLIALTGGELVIGQPAWVMYDGTNFDILSVTSTTVSSPNLANSSLSYGVPVNLQLNGTVNSNQLTIAVKGNNGSDPSVTNPVLFSFRDTTIASGDPVVVSLQAALSFTIGSGNTMGCVSNQMCRLWVLAFNNAGTVQLCAFNALSGKNIAPINEGVLQTSQSGTSGGSSAQLYYCNASAVTNKAVRIIGYVEISEATAGTWATGPTYVQLFGPGTKKPGDVVQSIIAIVTTQTLIVTNTNTSVSASITPSSAANLISINSNLNVLIGGPGTQGQFILSRGTGPTQVGSQQNVGGGGISSNTFLPVTLRAWDVPNTTSPVTYTSFGTAASNAIVNDASIGTGTPSSDIIIQEIMGSLQPANDDRPLRMVG